MDTQIIFWILKTIGSFLLILGVIAVSLWNFCLFLMLPRTITLMAVGMSLSGSWWYLLGSLMIIGVICDIEAFPDIHKDKNKNKQAENPQGGER